MAFNYTPSGCKLDSPTEQLLEKIDNFPYDRLVPYSKLGDIHAQLTVEVVDDIRGKERVITLTLGELKRQLEEIKKRNEEIEKILEESDRLGEDFGSMSEFLPTKIDTKDIENIIDEHSDDPDTTEVSLPINERIDGYYTRDHNKGLIVLAGNRSERTIAMTYVHELMHAYYDCACAGLMNNVKYVEEPLAEFGMLRFMEQFHSSDTAFSDLFLHCYFSVKKKQNSIGLVHYGFGAELYDSYYNSSWEEWMMQRHTIDENALLGSFMRYYKDIQDILKLSWPNYKDRHTVAKYIKILLKNSTNVRLSKPQKNTSWFPYVFLAKFRVHSLGNVNPGERVVFQKTKKEWITGQSGIRIHLPSMFCELEELIYRNSISQYLFHIVITEVDESEGCCVVEYNILPNVLIHHFFLNLGKDCLEVNIPYWWCNDIHIDGEHERLKITVDSKNKYFKFDEKNHILINKRNNSLVIGFSDSTIPASIRSIGDSAFDGCTGLTSIVIPDSVTEIGDCAFEYCKGLTIINIPDGVTEIADGAFEGCTSLTSIVIPNSVKEIGSSAFYGCTGLTSIDIPDSVTKIGNCSFEGCTRLTSIDIQNSVTEILWHAFYGCTGLTAIDIPNSVKEIDYNTFYGCTGLTAIYIPNSVTEIDTRAFMGCTGLTSIDIPNSVTKIGYEAFKGCNSLTKVSIPKHLLGDVNNIFIDCNPSLEIVEK